MTVRFFSNSTSYIVQKPRYLQYLDQLYTENGAFLFELLESEPENEQQTSISFASRTIQQIPYGQFIEIETDHVSGLPIKFLFRYESTVYTFYKLKNGMLIFTGVAFDYDTSILYNRTLLFFYGFIIAVFVLVHVVLWLRWSRI